MSKIKFDEKDFSGHSPLWEAVQQWGKTAGSSDSITGVEEAVQSLIKKYVNRERKRLARVEKNQQKIAIDGFLKNLAADWCVPVRMLTGSSAPIGKAEESGLERFFKREPKPMNWPADFPGKH